MGTARTPGYSSTMGILVPWGWRDVTSDVGTYFGHASTLPGPDSYTGDTRTRVELQGAPSYVDSAGAVQVPGNVSLQAVPNGGAGGSWVWHRDGGVWYGQERPVVVTGYARIEDCGADDAFAPSCLTLQSGHLLVAWGETTGNVRVRRREAGTEWTETTVDIDGGVFPETAPPDGVPTAMVQMPDGGILLMMLSGYVANRWGLAIYRSEDDGDTWTIQADEAVTWTTDAPRVMRAAVDDTGRVVLFVTRDTSEDSKASHYISKDGGITWTTVEADVNLNGGANTKGLVVWDARFIRGALVLLVEWGGGATSTDNGFDYIQVGDPAAAVLSTITTSTVTEVTNYTANERWIGGGCIAEDPASATGFVILSMGAAPYLVQTGPATAAAPADGGSAQMAQGQMTWWRGSLCVVCTRRSAAAISGDVYEIRLGGQADVTWTRDYVVYGLDYPVSWVGLGAAADSTFDADDSGAGVTRTNASESGQRIVTDGVSQGGYSPTIGSARGRVVMGVRVRVVSGTARLTLQASDGTDQFGIYVEITSTQIRAYDLTGAASSYTNHGATSADYIDVYAVVDARGGAASGRCYWRSVDGLYPHTTTDDIVVAGLTATAGTTTITRWRALASSDTYWLWAWTSSKPGINRLTVPAISQPWELLGVPLSGEEARHIADGMTGRVRGLPVRIDDTAHPVYMTGDAPFAHIFPDVVASPRKGWTMSSTRDNTIRLQPAPGSASADSALHTQWIGIYLAGLVGVHHITLAGLNYSGTVTVDLRYPLAYTPDGYSCTGVASGTNVPGRLVGVNELKDCYFECEAGVRRIIGNSPGTLSSGATVSEPRAVLWLDGSPGIAATGYIWPREAMVIVADSVRTLGEINITIESSDADTGTGTRTIGTLAAGPIYVMGMAPDRTMTRETQIGDEVVSLPDGSDYVVSRAPNRRRVEFAYVEGPHDVTGWWPPDTITSGSPDYVVTPTDSGKPDVFREPIEVLHSLVAAVGRSPIVALFGMKWQDTEGGIDVQTPVPWRQQTIYGRFAGNPRIQQISTMTEGVDMVRAELLAIEEIR